LLPRHSFVTLIPKGSAVRDGKVVEWRMYDSHQEAVAAVGLAG
jgi:hypothetical protein